ncbi:hypothetical protein PC9H_005316 [Pleurotus ostreatus]|uniref:AMP-activated protein kinase glycogen-binding domain-containing protein n=1 Tax=Pleurotus ostreatus TaxID=5322 RepID=A0A8H6ZZB4_PLEOS|nr:uncharacterized protein PC9H_005316 [Pleurotus ostreatus]KAF7433366.1 hypothetical protein PC9H_005316 [Pleurotus ostreatus]KAJ8697953.1 Cruciform DNA binding protein [Pleurotus ostreatus]
MNDLHEAVFRWPSTDVSDVIVTGTFDQWSSTVHLARTATGFEGVVKVPWGQRIPYKFVVDGVWRVEDGHPTERDAIGNVNNVYISPSKPVAAPTPAQNGSAVNGVPNGAPSQISKAPLVLESTPATPDVAEVEPAGAASQSETTQPTGEPESLAPKVPVEIPAANGVVPSLPISVPPPTVPIPADTSSTAQPTVEPSTHTPVDPQVSSPAKSSSTPKPVPAVPTKVDTPSLEASTHTPVVIAADAPAEVTPSASNGTATPTLTTEGVPSKATPEPSPDVAPSQEPNGKTATEAPPAEKTATDPVSPTSTAVEPATDVEKTVVPPAPTTPPPSAPTTPSKKGHQRFPSFPGSSSRSSVSDSPTSSKYSTTPRKKKDSFFRRVSSIFHHKDKDKEASKQNGH